MSAPAPAAPAAPALARGVAHAVSYAASHGIVVAQTKTAAAGVSLAHAPMTFRASPLAAAAYAHAVAITPPLNRLVARVADDYAYLRDTLAETARADPDFTGRLLAMLGKGREKDSVDLAISRFDYFENAEKDDRGAGGLRMVEINVIASSFACLSARTSAMHRHLATHPAVGGGLVGNMPENAADQGLARGIAKARGEYQKLHGGEGTVTVMIVQPGERNSYDQDLLRFELWDAHGVEMVRLTFAAVAEVGRVDGEGRLWVRLEGREAEVSVVYYRAGYAPDDYPTDLEWTAREMMEDSLAAKCPSVAMQLVGTKKVQQVLDRPGEVERFVGKKEAAEIRKTFAGQWSLAESDGGDKVAKMAVENPADYVLKPQREGGGNNLYGEEMRDALLRMTPGERSAYVLMERIRPVVVKNVLVREGAFEETDIVSEFGVYGVGVAVKGELVENFAAGTLLRSKAATQDDGGVAAGVAVLDSPVLVD